MRTWLPLALPAVAIVAGAQERISVDDYARAERFLSWNSARYVRSSTVDPRWMAGTDRFSYSRDTDAGPELVIVDPALSGSRMRRRCVPTDECGSRNVSTRADELVSPDGKWAAFVKDHDIWVRSLSTGAERALSDDGGGRISYGSVPGAQGDFLNIYLGERIATPSAVWSPDSKRLVVEKLDESGVLDFHYVQHVPADGSVRPMHHSFPLSLPGDRHKPRISFVVFDVSGGVPIPMRREPFVTVESSFVAERRVWWNAGTDRVYILVREDDPTVLQMVEMNPATGAVRALIRETSETYVDVGPWSPHFRNVAILGTGEIVWYSERDGWAHFYLHDARGSPVRQLTRGDWVVQHIVRVDEGERKLYFTASGRERGEDPYQRHLYVVGLDGSDLRLLTPENADHALTASSFSPSGKFFVATRSRPDLPPVTVLRSTEGGEIMRLEEADISALQAGGLRLPQPFSVLAADGRTRIYGNLFHPSNLDPARRYPVIDSIYPGPQVIRSEKNFVGSLFDWNAAQAHAELGFIVVTVDGRGTPLRSKAFRDASHGKVQESSFLEDHVAAIRQLAGRHPYMDLDRVGIYGHSAGGGAAARAMLVHPEFFKVAVSSNGDHDRRGIVAWWGLTYQGAYPSEAWERQVTARLAGNLRGKILFVQGELDGNVHPALTMQMMDALIRADKDFDFLLLPNAGHDLTRHVYFIRRRWHYFVQHLMGAAPPPAHSIRPASSSRP